MTDAALAAVLRFLVCGQIRASARQHRLEVLKVVNYLTLLVYHLSCCPYVLHALHATTRTTNSRFLTISSVFSACPWVGPPLAGLV